MIESNFARFADMIEENKEGDHVLTNIRYISHNGNFDDINEYFNESVDVLAKYFIVSWFRANTNNTLDERWRGDINITDYDIIERKYMEIIDNDYQFNFIKLFNFFSDRQRYEEYFRLFKLEQGRSYSCIINEFDNLIPTNFNQYFIQNNKDWMTDQCKCAIILKIIFEYVSECIGNKLRIHRYDLDKKINDYVQNFKFTDIDDILNIVIHSSDFAILSYYENRDINAIINYFKSYDNDNITTTKIKILLAVQYRYRLGHIGHKRTAKVFNRIIEHNFDALLFKHHELFERDDYKELLTEIRHIKTYNHDSNIEQKVKNFFI